MDPSVLSLPSGPGSVEGLGQGFDIQANSGTSSYGVDIVLAPTVAGFGPSLSLTYSSGRGNGVLGMGWAMDVPTVQRGTDRRLPLYDDVANGGADVFVLRGMGSTGAEELVEVANNDYRFRIEGAFVKGERRSDGGWTFRNRSGVRFEFSADEESTVVGSPAGMAAQVFSWCLTEQVDTFGHRIRYHYEKNEDGRPYLASVTYNDGAGEVYRNEVRFSYGNRPDRLVSYLPRFSLGMNQRLTKIEVLHGGEVLRTYDLSYSEDGGLSRLTRVHMAGRGGEALPPLEFEYAQFSPAVSGIVDMQDGPGRGPSSTAEINDVDGDGLPDLLVSDPALGGGQYRWYPNLDGERWGGAATLAQSPSVWMTNPDARLADMDGDGAADVLVQVTAGDVRYYPGAHVDSGGVVDGFGSRVDVGASTSFSFVGADARLVDLNHDRRSDWLHVDPATGALRVQMNLGAGQFSAPTSALPPLSSTEVLSFSDGLRFADLNGDGLQDLVVVRDGASSGASVRYFPSMGMGNFGEAVPLGPGPVLSSGERGEVRWSDLNGDGLSDLVHVGVSRVRYWLNLAGEALDVEREVRSTPDRRNAVVRFADMNGNGTTDIVWVDTTVSVPWRFLELLSDGTPGLMVRASNGLGRVTEFSYEGVGFMRAWARDGGISWTHRSPRGQLVLSEVRESDGLGFSSVSEFRVADGYFDGPRREFRGFARAVRRDLGDGPQPTLVSESLFDVGDVEEALKGRTLRVERRDAQGVVFDVQRSTYGLRSLSGGLRTFAFAKSSETEIVEGSPTPETVRTEWEYDDYGNMTREATWGRWDGQADGFGDDEKITVFRYGANLSKWVIGKVVEQVVTDGSGRWLEASRSYYDGDGLAGLPLGEVDRGVVRRQSAWVSGQGGEAVWIDRVRREFDSHGNPTSVRDGRGGRVELTYDGSARFVVSETRVVDGDRGLTWHAEYDAGLGVVTSWTTPNGHAHHATYDGLARLISRVDPGDSEGQPTLEVKYQLGAPLSYVRSARRTESGGQGQMVQIQYSDGFGRARGLFRQGDGGTWDVSGLVRLGARGHRLFEAHPSRVGSADWFAPTGNGGVTFGHDALGRVLREQEIDGAVRSTAYGPLQRVVSDENDNDVGGPHAGTPTTFVQDGLGRLVSVREVDGGRGVETRYGYDGLGNLTRIVDARGGIHGVTYDGLSRRLRLEDPNAGTWTFSYNATDQLTERVDGAGHRVEYRHDLLGRVVEEVHHREGDDAHLAVRMYYDGAGKDREWQRNLMGKLARVDDGGGEAWFSYDARGRETDMVRRFHDGTEHHTFRDFDSADRVTRRGFPDGSYLTYQYDGVGRMAAISGVAPKILWTPWGDLAEVAFGNGVRDERRYDDRLRLTSLGAHLAPGGNRAPLRSLSYTLDPASRVLGRQDGRTGLKDGVSWAESYSYDDRYRLTSVTDTQATTQYRYDDNANLVEVHSDHPQGFLNTLMVYGQGGGGPDRLVDVDGQRLEYDGAGRVVSDGERTFVWDAKGRLAEAVRGSVTEHYAYDFENRRVEKVVRRGGREVQRVRYVAGDVEERDGKLVRYVASGELRIARLDGVSGEGAVAAGGTVGGSARDSGLVFGSLVSAGRGPHLRGLGGAHPWLFALLGLVLAFAAWARRWVWLPALAVLALGCPGDGCESSGGGGAGFGARLNGKPIEAFPDDGVVYLGDRFGSVAAEVDVHGQATMGRSYFPYGALRGSAGEGGTHGYVGNDWDDGVGLGHFHARPYEPRWGMFLGVDPVALAPDPDKAGNPGYFYPYRYAFGDPINQHDRSGAVPVDTIADAVFIAYDIYRIAADNVFGNKGNLAENLNALSADAAGFLVPYATGLGVAARASAGVARGAKRIGGASRGVSSAVQRSNISKSVSRSGTRRGSKGPFGEARFVSDPAGQMVDIRATPPGNYRQPGGARTDVLQQRGHFMKGSRSHTHTHPPFRNVDSMGNVRTGTQRRARAVTGVEAKNIADGTAVKIQ